MSDSKTFSGVTDQIFECMKKNASKEHGTVYDPPDGNQGTATTSTIVGTLVMAFDLDVETSELTYSVKKKPVLIPEHEIWNGVEAAINACRQA